jgi:DNA (cytosine-5)-methyltransferase 1
MNVSENITGTLRAQEHGHPPLVFEPGIAAREGGHVYENIAGTIRANAGDSVQAVAYTAAFMGGQGAKSRSIAYSEKVSPTLRSEAGGNTVPMLVYDARGNGDGATVCTVTGDHNNRVTDYTALAVTPKAYSIAAYQSNAAKSANPDSFTHETDLSAALDTSGVNPACNQGGVAICVEGNFTRPTHKGKGASVETAYTINTVERNLVCYQDKVGALCACDYKFPQNQQIDEGKAIVEQITFGNNGFGRWDEKPATLKSAGGDYPGGENLVVENRYIVRRLTPRECAKLQGFNPAWLDGLGTLEPTKAEVDWWLIVFAEHARINGKTKAKSRKQVIKWLQDPYTDGAAYKLWGNGLCKNCAVFVLRGICEVENSG